MQDMPVCHKKTTLNLEMTEGEFLMMRDLFTALLLTQRWPDGSIMDDKFSDFAKKCILNLSGYKKRKVNYLPFLVL